MGITAIAIGLIVTALGVAFGGLVLEGLLFLLSRALRDPIVPASIEPSVEAAAIHEMYRAAY